MERWWEIGHRGRKGLIARWFKGLYMDSFLFTLKKSEMEVVLELFDTTGGALQGEVREMLVHEGFFVESSFFLGFFFFDC